MTIRIGSGALLRSHSLDSEPPVVCEEQQQRLGLPANRTVNLPQMSLEPLDLALPRDLEQLARLRVTLGDWLDRAGVNGHDRDEIILAAHEAVANGIEHSEGDGELRARGAIDDQAVTVTVTSPGPWREPQTRPGRGKGLMIIGGLTEVDIDARATSTDVRMRRRLGTPR